MSEQTEVTRHLIGIVDDDDDVRISLCALVESLGYDGEAFETADAFIASGEPARFSCVVTDLQMPGTNGLQLAHAIRDNGPPVILITAFPTPSVEQQALDAGVHYFLRKPFDPGKLIDLLESILA